MYAYMICHDFKAKGHTVNSFGIKTSKKRTSAVAIAARLSFDTATFIIPDRNNMNKINMFPVSPNKISTGKMYLRSIISSSCKLIFGSELLKQLAVGLVLLSSISSAN